MTAPAALPVEIGLSAAIVTIDGADPAILTVPWPERGGVDGLPFGAFDPISHRTFETGLRTWVEEQTGFAIGYVEQLYTFGDRGRHAGETLGPHVVSVGYLALTRIGDEEDAHPAGAHWRSWYRHLPWEDWRTGRPAIIEGAILPALRPWADADAPDPRQRRLPPRSARLRLAFGLDGVAWDEERVLERYELLYEAGLLHEAAVDGRPAAPGPVETFGQPMVFDHRRILATAIARLRSKLKYRPVIFELMQPEFTLGELQRAVEAIAGRHLHTQNFRRLIETAELVEATGGARPPQRGRPAALYRFRRAILEERPAPGIRLGRR